ncbi:hypothetical protein AAFF_G00408620 [Aldrovandia affinis]|uniref:Uncharacterized protein n=1 Tax=Aldrovandia affinis TaxID=143900 RepID=A0AAD7SCC4_9TELE|nr:hypothetical protein AAFF_G00408620 [Aldrovandia affinis]
MADNPPAAPALAWQTGAAANKPHEGKPPRAGRGRRSRPRAATSPLGKAAKPSLAIHNPAVAANAECKKPCLWSRPIAFSSAEQEELLTCALPRELTAHRPAPRASGRRWEQSRATHF